MSNREPSRVTKILVNKIHGGRKQDSKFWQSEFDNSFSAHEAEMINTAGKKRFVFPVIIFFIFSIASVASLWFWQPQLFQDGPKNGVIQRTLFDGQQVNNSNIAVEDQRTQPQHTKSVEQTKAETVTNYINEHKLRKEPDDRSTAKSYSSQSKKPIHSYSFKDKSGIFRTLETTEVLNSRTVNGRQFYTGNTDEGEKIAKFLNDRHGIALE